MNRAKLSCGMVLVISVAGCTMTREVKITSSPPEARVLIDDVDHGNTPLTHTLKWQPETFHHIQVRAEDYETTERFLSQPAAAAALQPWSLHFDLIRVRHVVPVEITANVDGAEVFVDNELIGTTPLTHRFEFLRASEYAPWSNFDLRINKNGYRWRSPTRPADPGEARPFTTNLTRERALASMVEVELEPIGLLKAQRRAWEFNGQRMAMVEETVLGHVDPTEPLGTTVERVTELIPGEMMSSRISLAALDSSWVYSLGGPNSAHLRSQATQGITRLTTGKHIDLEPSVTPDGRFIYFSSNRLSADRFNLWRMRSSGQGGLTKITDSPSATVDTEPVVSPDGTRIAFTSFLRSTGAAEIWTANADGTLLTQLRPGRNPAWSPDGRMLAHVHRDEQGFDQIWIMKGDGGNPQQLTTGAYHHRYPIFIPDGTRLLYACDRARNSENMPNFDIWTMHLDGSHATQLTSNESYDTRPAMTSDGRQVYFLSNRGLQREREDYWQIWRMALPTE